VDYGREDHYYEERKKIEPWDPNFIMKRKKPKISLSPISQDS
jgi:hypothetical protein